MAKKVVKWIQKTGLKKGALSRQLGVPIEENIPITLLRKIQAAKAGDIIINPTKVGKRRIKVTSKIERRSILAIRLKQMAMAKRTKKKIKIKRRAFSCILYLLFTELDLKPFKKKHLYITKLILIKRK